MKKIISVLLALVMTLALSVTALAAGGYSIKVTNTNESVSIKGNTYYAYKIFDATYDNSKHVAYTIDKDFEGFTYTVDGKSYSGETLINYLATLTNNSEALDKAGLLPSLNASMNQGVTYRPFQESGGNFVNGGIASNAADKATQSGSYGINASWTLWNGGKNRLNVQNSELEQHAVASTSIRLSTPSYPII